MKRGLSKDFHLRRRDKEVFMKRIIITGTSRGIGFELAKQFAREGHQVLALSRKHTPCADLNLQNLTAFPFDITEASHFQKVVDFIESDWEGVDIVIEGLGGTSIPLIFSPLFGPSKKLLPSNAATST